MIYLPKYNNNINCLLGATRYKLNVNILNEMLYFILKIYFRRIYHICWPVWLPWLCGKLQVCRVWHSLPADSHALLRIWILSIPGSAQTWPDHNRGHQRRFHMLPKNSASQSFRPHYSSPTVWNSFPEPNQLF